MSLDGYLTRPPGETRWLTSESSRTHAHQLRALVDAIIVGAETIRRDNPRLTVRKGPRRTQPWRVILTKSGRLPRNATIFRDSKKERTLVYRNRSLRMVLRDLGRREITSVLIEGGGDVESGSRSKINRQSANLHCSHFYWRRRVGVWGKRCRVDATIATAGFTTLRTNWSRYLHHRHPKKATDITAE